MLSIDKCTKILNQSKRKLTEKQVEQIRAFLYNAALIEFENFKKIKGDEQRSYLHESVDR
jgi:effector-binding domain-containing protein